MATNLSLNNNMDKYIVESLSGIACTAHLIFWIQILFFSISRRYIQSINMCMWFWLCREKDIDITSAQTAIDEYKVFSFSFYPLIRDEISSIGILKID